MLSGRRPIIQIAERSILQPPKIVTQPKIISKVSQIQTHVLPEKSGKHVDNADLVTKLIVILIVTEITPSHVKVPDIENVVTKPKPKILRQDIRHENPTYAGPIYRPPLTVPPTQIYPRKTKNLHIDSLE